jgi:hypothetical protein
MATPTLHLLPLGPSEPSAPFGAKHLALSSDAARVKLGRSCIQESGQEPSLNAKLDEPTNGWFPSTTISRLHAEVWADGEKVTLIIFLKHPAIILIHL